jgi:Na+/proline symporter
MLEPPRMDFLGLHYVIWVVVALYFLGMLLLGWWSKRGIHDREGFLLGKRQFGVPMMIMHAFGAGTHPGDVTGVMSATVRSGASGIWVSWMWMFGTPFYWIIAPIVRRMRCLTLADYFEERFGKAATFLYVAMATIGMTVAAASMLLATARTVQGMMGKAEVSEVQPAPAAKAAAAAPVAAEERKPAWAARGLPKREADAWFYGILFVTTAVFLVYSYWGGIIAAIRTDFVQGLMIIALSFLAIPAAMALPQVGGWSGTVETLTARSTDYLGLFDPKTFSLATVLLLCINAPISMLAQPHLMTVCGAGKAEWEGRMGFTYGNVLKRICTMGWCILALCWLAFLFKTGERVHADAAFGDSVRALLHPVLQGVMLACVMAAGMSTGSAIQVTVAGLFSQNIYRHYIRPDADDDHYVHVTKVAGLAIIAAATGVAIYMRHSVVTTILDYFNIMSFIGVASAMGILWRRMNQGGVFTSLILAAASFLATRYVIEWSQAELVASGMLSVAADGARTWAPGCALGALANRGLLTWSADALVCSRLTVTALPLVTAILGGIIGSLLTRRPSPEVIEKFLKKIYTPVGQEAKLDLPLDEALPRERRLLTAGGLFLMKPSRQSWVGFLVTLAVCLVLIGVMLLLLG